jgi:hypothetical protein
MGYKTDTNTVKGFVTKGNGAMEPVNVTLNYTKAYNDESVKISTGGTSITLEAKALKKIMGVL